MNKNIILFSDGTGQRGGVGFESNVWRLYHAIEHDEQQIRFYDDGVGTEDFKFLKALGGGMGVGLSRNVRELYKFLVRHYQPGDNIYLFGFSRGAFTVRLLAGMIAECGVIRINNPEITSSWDLDQLIRAAYCAYRERHYHPERTKQFCELYSHFPDGSQPIRFVGVWDTVDAVGVPFDELREALDRILHLSFKDKKLHKNIRYACHAVAIDDERHTFHPIMWNEKEGDAERLNQVWFSGVHSNVGGGYPKKEMAMVTLEWMIEQAHQQELRINQHEKMLISSEADVTGKLYNSRSGTGLYYRYKPRNLETIRASYTDGPLQLHPSAIVRTQNASIGYAPFNLTENVTCCDGSPSFSSNETWKEAMEHVWDTVWWRRLAYFTLVTLTLFTLTLPLTQQWLPHINSELLFKLGGTIATFLSSTLSDLLGFGWLVNSTLGVKILTVFIMKPIAPLMILIGISFATILHLYFKHKGTIVANAGWAAVYPEHRPTQTEDIKKAKKSWLLKIARLARNCRLLKMTINGFKQFFVLSMVVVLYLPLKSGRVINNWYCFRGKILAPLRNKK